MERERHHQTIVQGNPPMEKWMKEQAAKFHGGLCMSKFVQLSEKKRLARLQTVKSTVAQRGWNCIPQSSCTSKAIIHAAHCHVKEKTQNSIKDVYVSNRDVIHSEHTRTGLTLRLQLIERGSCKVEEASNVRCKEKSNLLHKNEMMVPRSRKDGGKENEEKQRPCDNKVTTVQMLSHRKDSCRDHAREKPTSKVKFDRTRRKCNHGIILNSQAHISLSSLTKEREEALVLLKSLGYDKDAFHLLDTCKENDGRNNAGECQVACSSSDHAVDLTTLCQEQDASPFDTSVHHADSFFR